MNPAPLVFEILPLSPHSCPAMISRISRCRKRVTKMIRVTTCSRTLITPSTIFWHPWIQIESSVDFSERRAATPVSSSDSSLWSRSWSEVLYFLLQIKYDLFKKISFQILSRVIATSKLYSLQLYGILKIIGIYFMVENDCKLIGYHSYLVLDCSNCSLVKILTSSEILIYWN